MIKIVYEPAEYAVTVTGHACFDEVGKDIVCAWVSALTESMLQRVKGRRVWQPAYGVNREKATVRVRLTPRTSYSASMAREMLATICTGYRLIAQRYPDHVHYEER